LLVTGKPNFEWNALLESYYVLFLIFLWPMPLFLTSTHKKCILSHFIHNSTAMFPLKPNTLAGFEPGSSCYCGGCDVHCAMGLSYCCSNLINFLVSGIVSACQRRRLELLVVRSNPARV
jgi:hypothetical protein